MLSYHPLRVFCVSQCYPRHYLLKSCSASLAHLQHYLYVTSRYSLRTFKHHPLRQLNITSMHPQTFILGCHPQHHLDVILNITSIVILNIIPRCHPQTSSSMSSQHHLDAIFNIIPRCHPQHIPMPSQHQPRCHPSTSPPMPSSQSSLYTLVGPCAFMLNIDYIIKTILFVDSIAILFKRITLALKDVFTGPYSIISIISTHRHSRSYQQALMFKAKSLIWFVKNHVHFALLN